MPTVFAGKRSIVHRGDGQVNVAAPPDICKTPTPGGPMPIPYINIAKTSDLASPAKSIKIEGHPSANAASYLATSTGDESGTAGGGIISSKVKGKMTWATQSPNVTLEGKGAVCFCDVTQHNGNSFNTLFKQEGGTGLAYGDDFVGLCPICRKGPSEHRILETPDSARKCAEIIAALQREYRLAADEAEKAKKANKKGFSDLARKKNELGGGYMVGVMICKCPKAFAARSGTSTNEFARVVTQCGAEPIGGGRVYELDFLRANSSGASNLRRELIKTFDKADGRAKRGSNGYNPTGTCAGAKLVTHSHAPAEMTEMHFMPPIDFWHAEYSVISNHNQNPASWWPKDLWRKLALENALSERELTVYRTGMSVASCHTCQLLLPLALCP